MDTIENKAKCLDELLDLDRYDWENFHEDFVRILVKYGYQKHLTEGENEWYENEAVSGRELISLTDYTEPD
jgi:hypothetical protein